VRDVARPGPTRVLLERLQERIIAVAGVRRRSAPRPRFRRGRAYVGRLSGKLLAEARDVFVYLTDDERVIVYDAKRLEYHEIEHLTELAGWFPHDFDVYRDLMHMLKETPEVDF
jgi:hypothetical protein